MDHLALAVRDQERSRRFYERCGWSDAGPLDYAAKVPGRGTLPVPTHRYTKRLGHALEAGAG